MCGKFSSEKFGVGVEFVEAKKYAAELGHRCGAYFNKKLSIDFDDKI
ncbi:hypothetical protein [uncultured Campylobacter sp.]|nr:hypothetical protein [uncultured Campylobacter sp.]